MSRETVQCTRYWPSWRCCYGVMWDCVSHSVSENVHSQKGFWNKHHVSISSRLCFSKMGLYQFLLTLNLLFLGILNWIFRHCSAEMVVSSLGVLFLECLKFSSLLAAAVWYPYEASQFILNSSRTGSVAVQWEGPCTLAKFSLEVLASETSIFASILKHWNVQHAGEQKSALPVQWVTLFSCKHELPRGIDVLTAPLSPLSLIHSMHLLHSGNSF